MSQGADIYTFITLFFLVAIPSAAFFAYRAWIHVPLGKRARSRNWWNAKTRIIQSGRRLLPVLEKLDTFNLSYTHDGAEKGSLGPYVWREMIFPTSFTLRTKDLFDVAVHLKLRVALDIDKLAADTPHSLLDQYVNDVHSLAAETMRVRVLDDMRDTPNVFIDTLRRQLKAHTGAPEGVSYVSADLADVVFLRGAREYIEKSVRADTMVRRAVEWFEQLKKCGMQPDHAAVIVQSLIKNQN